MSIKQKINTYHKSLLLAFIVSIFLMPIPSQAAPPGAGDILQQMQQKKPQAPSSTTTGLPAISTPKQHLPKGVSFHVLRIEVTGNTLFSTSTLHALVSSGEGKNQSLQQLETLATKITDYYHGHGYSLSRAIIPAQQIKNGVVEFRVIEARFDRINLANHSKARLGLLQSTLSSLQSGDIINDNVVNHALLLLSDIPGVVPGATLKPGSKAGTTDLDIVAKPRKSVAGDISVDNFGNRYTGRARVGAGLVINNPFHYGDMLNLGFMSAGNGMDYGSAAYNVVLNGYGTSFGASFSAMHYILGGTLDRLHAYGRAVVASTWLKQPLVRNLTFNLYMQAQYDNKRLNDNIEVASIHTDRHMNDGAFTLSGDFRDHWIGMPAVSTFRATWTMGNLIFDDPAAKQADAASANTAGHFSKWQGTATRLQALDSYGDTLYVMVTGQWAHQNLDSVEKMAIGGPYSLRGYDMGALSVDTGYVCQIELRHRLDRHWQLKAFVDGGHMSVNHLPWASATGVNVYTLGDVGFGIDVNVPDRFHLEGYLADPAGRAPAALVDQSNRVRGWVQLSKLF